MAYPTKERSDGFYVTWNSNKSALICGCMKVSVYEDTRIMLKMRHEYLIITGTGLTLKSYFGNEIEIYGSIRSISIESTGGDR